MGTYDVRLLSASYSRDSANEPYIELFGKTRDRRSVTAAVYGFKPYFFVAEPDSSLEERLRTDTSVTDLAHVTLFYKGKDRDCLKATLSDPGSVIRLRNSLSPGYTVLAGDIQYHDRYIYDTDMGSCIRITGEECDLGYCTDITVKLESFENIEPFDPGLKYLSFDIENSITEQTIYCICTKVEEAGKFSTPEPITGTEKEIIRKFSELIEKTDPDVITGYNIDNYDIRKIIERAEYNGMKDALPWGRDRGQPKLFSERFWRVKGRIISDAWWAVKKEMRPKQETLNAVSKLILGEEKLDVDPKHMDDEWKNNRDRVMEYCIQDANLALRILLAVGTLRKGMDLAAVTALPTEDVLVSGTSTLVDSLLIRAADRSGVAVPMSGKKRAQKDSQIAGGYVHTMKPGLYHWVTVLDFKSMYPSLIIANNVCFTTLCADGEIEAPSGARYMSPERKKGLLPAILTELMERRDSIKKRMKQTSDPYEHGYLDGLQAAVKIVMNTFYGVFASDFYRFTDKGIGASITSFARSRITGIISDLENEGHPVIYGDTDSVFILSPGNSLEEAVEFGKEQSERFSRNGMTLEFEKLLEPLFSHGMKKRYVGRVVWPEKQDDLLVRGYEIRRSDSFDLQSRMLTELFGKILDEDNSGALALVKDTIRDVVSGKVPAEDLVISRTCRGLDAYENPERMANVQAARKLIAKGYNFIPGMKISWIVTDASSAPQEVEPFISGVPFGGTPDYRYYAERLAHMAARITEVFGWNEADLMMGSQQKTLFDDDFIPLNPGVADPTDGGKATVKKAVRTRSLDEFL